MQSPILTIQYLEDSPNLPQLDEKQVINKLLTAAEKLPFTHLLIGWHLPPRLLEACRQEAERLKLRFLRWHPVLTLEKDIHPQHEWHTVNLIGQKIAGYHGLPEFTFACPNHPDVREVVLQHLDNIIHSGLYHGFFLDRVRFPSPATDLLNDFGCFCEHCHRKAAVVGLDLEQIRVEILRVLKKESGRKSLVIALLSQKPNPGQVENNPSIIRFLELRKLCLLDFVASITHPIKEAGLEIGLDCFSPSLTGTVGQDLHRLSGYVDWIKVMIYAHTLAPAGIPFELSGFLHYLTKQTQLNEEQSLDWISQSIGLPLPHGLESIEKFGLSSSALEQELKHGIVACSVPVLAGLELVELPGITRLNPDQIKADLITMKRALPAGLSISWDLVNIPLDRLDLVRQVYFED